VPKCEAEKGDGREDDGKSNERKREPVGFQHKIDDNVIKSGVPGRGGPLMETGGRAVESQLLI